MFNTIRRIRWKNITGLVLFIIIIFVLLSIIAFVNVLVHGDCVEKEHIKVCFSVEKSNLDPQEVTTINTDVTNTGETIGSATISLRMSPNLKNMSETAQKVDQMAPGDTVKRQFRVGARKELGKFKVEFDIDQDEIADKEIFLTVRKAA